MRVHFSIVVWLSFSIYLHAVNHEQSPRLFSKTSIPAGTTFLITDPHALLKVAQSTLNFIRKYEKNPLPPIKVGTIGALGYTLEDVKGTLVFIIKTIEEDKRRRGKFRITDPKFLEQHFTFIRWYGDYKQACKHGIKLWPGDIRLTYYLVHKVHGSYRKSKHHCYALYAAPEDENGLNPTQIEQRKRKLLRFKYTKQHILDGALNGKKIKPLIWVDREGLEEALMQGTVCVRTADGKEHYFNVDKDNAIPYDRTLTNREKQKRYWYFKPINYFARHGKIDIQPEVTFAGDVNTIGLGKIIVLRSKDFLTGQWHMRLGVLADKGGAFENNLYQLDYFTGTFWTDTAFKRHIKNLPAVAQAFILIKKS